MLASELIKTIEDKIKIHGDGDIYIREYRLDNTQINIDSIKHKGEEGIFIFINK